MTNPDREELVKPRKHYFVPSDDDFDTCMRCGKNIRNGEHCSNTEQPETDAEYIERLETALRRLASTDSGVKGESEPVAWPANLNPRTLDLVQRFALALAKKLRLAEEKYGHADGWSRDDWEAECRDHLYQHLEKGDPRDVAAYCAFMWHHGWITYRPEITATPADAGMREALESLQAWCDDQGALLGAVDGYGYHSGQEAAYRHVAIEIGRRINALLAYTAPTPQIGEVGELARLKQGIRDIAQACVDGRVCDDVAWFTEIPAETLFDKCCNLLGEDLPTGQSALTPAGRAALEQEGK